MSTPPPSAGSDRPATMLDVAARAGVSRQLVSMVMRGVAGPSEASRERVLAAAAELGFQVNTSARLLRQSRSRLIGVMFAARNSFESRLVERLVERAPRAGLGVVLSPSTATRDTNAVIAELRGHRVEALACYNPDPASEHLSRALGTMPVVWLGEPSPDPRASSVFSDDRHGLQLAVDHLVSLGHTAISYVGGRGQIVGPERAESYRLAMHRAGLADRITVIDASFDEESAATATRTLLASGDLPTAIIGCSDQAAIAIKTVLTAAGVRVPEDISVIGYDNSTVAALSFNALTSVHQDVETTVDEILATITEQLATPGTPPRRVATPATLVVRSSTGPARTHMPSSPTPQRTQS
ncbi:MAG: LacI family DNA-binding transcriptional regulator [Mycetocola sp.]